MACEISARSVAVFYFFYLAANTCSNAGGGVIMAFESGRVDAGTYANTPQGSAECCNHPLIVVLGMPVSLDN